MFKLVVLSSVLAMAASSAIAPLGLGWGGLGFGHLGLGAPLGLAGPLGLGAPLGLGIAAPLASPIAIGAPALGAYNYRGPLSLAPGQPANILAADGRPLDTLSVNLDRAAHLTARAVDGHGLLGLHHLKKRSAPLLAPAAAWSHSARIDLPGARLLAPTHLGVPAGAIGFGWGGPIAPLGLGPLGLGHAGRLGLGLGVGHEAPLGIW